MTQPAHTPGFNLVEFSTRRRVTVMMVTLTFVLFGFIALGDLYTAGAPILGRYVGHRAGHTLTNQLLRALFARPEAWRRVPCDETLLARLPGAGLGAEDLADLPAVA